MQHLEREWLMSTQQRALVDSSFEEGSYEHAIAMLEQFRSPTHKPSISHVRQLIYISLHSAREQKLGGKDRSRLESPTKPTKQQKTTFVISPEAVLAAQRLLMSFVTTNTPEALGQALPHFSDFPNASLATEGDSADSAIAKQAICIKEAKSCWTILEEDFLLRTKLLFQSPPGKGKGRRETLGDDLLLDERSQVNGLFVGEDAWPILDFILALFEHDELSTQEKGAPKHSPLLLKQIPPPRSPDGVRWEISAPLAIVFNCYQQDELSRQRMGDRLLKMLINLSATALLDLPMFVTSVFHRLPTSDPEAFTLLLSNLSPCASVHKFKIALCQKLLNDGVSSKSSKKVRVRPQARAQPKATPIRELDQLESGIQSSDAAQKRQLMKHPLPQCDELIRLIETDLSSPELSPATKALLLRAKFELLHSFASLQQELPAEQHLKWKGLLNGNKLMDIIDAAFGIDSEGTVHLELLHCIVPTW